MPRTTTLFYSITNHFSTSINDILKPLEHRINTLIDETSATRPPSLSNGDEITLWCGALKFWCINYFAHRVPRQL